MGVVLPFNGWVTERRVETPFSSGWTAERWEYFFLLMGGERGEGALYYNVLDLLKKVIIKKGEQRWQKVNN